MTYVYFGLIALVSTCAIYFFCHYEGVLATAIKGLPIKKGIPSDFTPFTQRGTYLLMGGALLLLVLLQWSLYQNTELIGYAKLYVLAVITICSALVDIKRKIIPNPLILFGLLAWVGITVYEWLYSEHFKDVIISELIGFAVGFVLLAAVSAITKGAIGFGDVKLFGVIGLLGGAFCTYSTLLVSLLVSVVVSVVGMIMKKITRKDSIPFGPCICIGYILVVFLTSY